MRVIGLLSLCVLALAAFAPGAAAEAPKMTYAKAQLEADREAKQLCQILPKSCGSYSSDCSRLSRRKISCRLVAREGREVGDHILAVTMHYYWTTRGKFVKELVDADKSRVGR